MGTVYQINKGLNRPISFKGLKVQYIAYLGDGLVALLLIYSRLHLGAADGGAASLDCGFGRGIICRGEFFEQTFWKKWADEIPGCQANSGISVVQFKETVYPS